MACDYIYLLLLLFTYFFSFGYYYNHDFNIKWNKFTKVAMKKASASHSSCTDGGTEERIHPAFKMYFEMQDANPKQGEKAKKNRKKCGAIEKEIGLRQKSITGKHLQETIEDADEAELEEKRDEVVENGCVVEDKEEIEVVKTTKKRKRRKLSPTAAKESETGSGYNDDDVGGVISDFAERKNRIYDMMEGFLSNSSSSAAAVDPERPYKNLDLEQLQEKIEKQENEIAAASNEIVKQCGKRIMEQLVDEVKIRLN